LLQADPVARPAKPSAAPRRSSNEGPIVTALGFGMASIIGLTIGYYLLCFFYPHANFLQLSPGWFPWKVEQTQQADPSQEP
jgi:hypothetical protein